jgi:glycosyltransferase involved in cell wall biosynthesis
MRIAQIAPLYESVPPKLYGGSEKVVSWLTEELLGLGHYVALFSSGDSAARDARVAPWPSVRAGPPRRAPSARRPQPYPAAAYASLLEALRARADNFDVIHCHVDGMHLPLLRQLGKPFLATLHNSLDAPCSSMAVSQLPAAWFVATTVSQRARLPELNWAGTVHHGLPAAALAPRFTAGDYLALLGRREKDQDIATRLARATGMPLRVAGRLTNDGKQAFLGHATALLFPGHWPGLAVIEAMACGKPLIAWRHGSAAEFIDDGVTGFIVDSERHAAEAVRRVRELDRHAVREAFDQRFTARRMALDYVSIYRKLAGEKKQDRAPARKDKVPPRSAIEIPRASGDSQQDAAIAS